MAERQRMTLGGAVIDVLRSPTTTLSFIINADPAPEEPAGAIIVYDPDAACGMRLDFTESQAIALGVRFLQMAGIKFQEVAKNADGQPVVVGS